MCFGTAGCGTCVAVWIKDGSKTADTAHATLQRCYNVRVTQTIMFINNNNKYNNNKYNNNNNNNNNIRLYGQKII